MHLSVFANYSEENSFFFSQSVIFYAVRSPKLNQWLNSDIIQEQLQKVHQDPHYVEVDSNSFYHNIDEDYDLRHGGISKTSFLNCYFTWIQYCASRKDPVSLSFVWLLACEHPIDSIFVPLFLSYFKTLSIGPVMGGGTHDLPLCGQAFYRLRVSCRG